MNCVGWRNHKTFLMFVTYCTIVEVHYVSVLWNYLSSNNLSTTLTIILNINRGFNILLSMGCIGIVFFHFILAITNQTTISRMKSQ